MRGESSPGNAMRSEAEKIFVGTCIDVCMARWLPSRSLLLTSDKQ